MRRAFSVGTRWALLYTFVTSIALSIPIGFIYVNVKRQIERDAGMLIESYLAEVRSEVHDHPDRPEVAVGMFTTRLRRITPDLDYGAALVRPDGSSGFRIGSLAGSSPLPAFPRAGGGPQHRVQRLGDGGQTYLIAASPFQDGLLVAAMSNRSFAGGVDQIRQIMFISAPLALVLSALCGGWLARRSLQPIAHMTNSARRIGGENLSERIPTRGTDDELDRLAATLNEMFDRIGNAMLRLRGFSADAAHQLKSPLASLQNQIEVTLGCEELDEATRRLLERILTQVGELGASVGAMLRLARSESGLREEQVAPIALGQLLEGVVSLFQPVAEARGITLQLSPGNSVEVQGEVAWLRELFASLVQNALVHTPAGGSVGLSVAEKPGEVVIQVTDTGVGIAEAEHERIFDRFYRVSPARDVPGSGLGLALARQIAVAHGGAIEVESRPGHGATFTVRLPRRSRSRPKASPPAVASTSLRRPAEAAWS